MMELFSGNIIHAEYCFEQFHKKTPSYRFDDVLNTLLRTPMKKRQSYFLLNIYAILKPYRKLSHVTFFSLRKNKL